MENRTRVFASLLGLAALAVGGTAWADDFQNCPEGLGLDDEFGPGTTEVTRCLENKKAKMLVAIGEPCSDAACTQPYALGNIKKALVDYGVTHGLDLDADVDIVVVAFAGGGKLLIQGNQFEDQVVDLMNQGVHFYICQNTMRAFINKGLLPANDATGALIDGVEQVPAGITAVVDFQELGYHLYTPL